VEQVILAMTGDGGLLFAPHVAARSMSAGHVFDNLLDQLQGPSSSRVQTPMMTVGHEQVAVLTMQHLEQRQNIQLLVDDRTIREWFGDAERSPETSRHTGKYGHPSSA
jgi:hypothetical protein